MKKAVDSGSQQLGKAFESALKHYLKIDKNNQEGLGSYIYKFKESQFLSPLDKNRLFFYSSIRNKASHDYYTQLMDYCGFVQYIRHFLIKYLKFASDTLPNPIDYLQIPPDHNKEED